MKRPNTSIRAAVVLAIATMPGLASAQTPVPSPPPVPDTMTAVDFDPGSAVIRNDLSGPRFGVLLAPDGARSQFGWHGEHQVSSGTNGPWFLVEPVFMVAGVENHEFIPNGTVVFGFRTRDGFEFGLGPGISVGGSNKLNTALVLAAGKSFSIGGIRVPIDVALSTNREGQRVSLVTGWAVRNPPVQP